MSFLKNLVPRGKWRLPALLVSSVFAGLFIFSSNISNAQAYVRNKPGTCVNCLKTLLVRCHPEAKSARDKGASEEQMKTILTKAKGTGIYQT